MWRARIPCRAGADNTGAARFPLRVQARLQRLFTQPQRIKRPTPHDRAPDILRGVETILSVLEVVIAVVVILLILMHSGKDSGLSGAFGVGSGTGPLGGGSLVERNLNRWTIFFAVLFFLNALVLLKHPWS
jgi:preprotein translocase subunit SecG